MQNIFNNIFKREQQIAPAETSEQTAPQSNIQGGNFAGNAVRINPVSALSVSAWYRASEVLANTMSQMTLEYQKLNDKYHGGNYEIDLKASGRDINYLLSVCPNPTMTASEFWKQMTIARFFEGNAVAYVERDSEEEVYAIWICSTAVLNTETMTYSITYRSDRGMLAKNNVSQYDIIHWRNTFSMDNGLTGIGTLQYARDTLSLAATNDRNARDNSAKGGKLKLIITEDTKSAPTGGLNRMNKAQKTYVRDDLQESLNEGRDVLLMSGMMSVTPISQDAQSQQLLETRKFDVPSIARFSGVPPVLLMDYSNNTYKAPEQATQEFIMRTIAPMANSIELEFNRKMIGRAGFPIHRFHFNDSSLMRLDPMGLANLGKIQIETGVKCVNELRAANDLPYIDGGDRHFVSANLKPIEEKKGDEV